MRLRKQPYLFCGPTEVRGDAGNGERHGSGAVTSLGVPATGSLASVLLLSAWSCARTPADSEVQAAFMKENHNSVVTNVSSVYPNVPAGKQGGDIVHKHIRFRSAASAVECEVVWGYSDGEPEWTLFYKSEPALAGTLCKGCTMKPCPPGPS